MNAAEPLSSRITAPSRPPRLYYVHPLMLAETSAWDALLQHASSLGFDTVLTAPLFARAPGGSVFVTSDATRVDPAYGLGDALETGMTKLCDLAAGHGLRVMVDLVIDRQAEDGKDPSPVLADPRLSPNDRGSRLSRPSDAEAAHRLGETWRGDDGPCRNIGLSMPRP